MNKNDTIICRCEDVSLQQIIDYLDQGFTTFEDLKRLLRVGMGPCQATTCGFLIQKVISDYTKAPMETIKPMRTRPLVLSIPLGSITDDK